MPLVFRGIGFGELEGKGVFLGWILRVWVCKNLVISPWHGVEWGCQDLISYESHRMNRVFSVWLIHNQTLIKSLFQRKNTLLPKLKLLTLKSDRRCGQNRDFRTHLKRLCRETVCFSKKDDMHYGIIKAYIFLRNEFGSLVKVEHTF